MNLISLLANSYCRKPSIKIRIVTGVMFTVNPSTGIAENHLLK